MLEISQFQTSVLDGKTTTARDGHSKEITVHKIPALIHYLLNDDNVLVFCQHRDPKEAEADVLSLTSYPGMSLDFSCSDPIPVDGATLESLDEPFARAREVGPQMIYGERGRLMAFAEEVGRALMDIYEVEIDFFHPKGEWLKTNQIFTIHRSWEGRLEFQIHDIPPPFQPPAEPDEFNERGCCSPEDAVDREF
jgi:hypothetical protein